MLTNDRNRDTSPDFRERLARVPGWLWIFIAVCALITVGPLIAHLITR